MGDEQVYEKVNTAWKQTCKILFGDEIGDLKEYEEWLSEYMSYPVGSKPSVASGKEVTYSVPNYPKSADFLSLEEVDFNKKFEPLNINEIKDIDSIVESIQERFQYTGNVILENSKEVARSSNVSNSFYIYNSNFVDDSKYVAYSTEIGEAENIYGVDNAEELKFMVRSVNTGLSTRCFEVNMTGASTDCYYMHHVENCINAMFCFNVKAKRYAIGNLELPPDKYKSIHAKLLEELRVELEKNKRLPSIAELASPDKMPDLPEVKISDEPEDKAPIEAAFGKTTSTLLGKKLTGMDEYKDWLMQHVKKLSSAPSLISGKPVLFPVFYPYTAMPPGKRVKEDEGIQLGEKLRLAEDDLGSLDEIRGSLWKIALYSTEGRYQKNTNVFTTAVSANSSNCYMGGVYIRNEYCGFSYWSRRSRYVFGCENAHTSHTSIHCYHSVDLCRCLDVDSSSNSSDLYFSHNCENVNDSMFCFNKKNLRYSIGNASIGPEKYKPLKVALLEQVTDELEQQKSFHWNIYNIAGS